MTPADAMGTMTKTARHSMAVMLLIVMPISRSRKAPMTCVGLQKEDKGRTDSNTKTHSIDDTGVTWAIE